MVCEGAPPLDVPAIWLYDNRVGSRDPFSGQRTHTLADFPTAITIGSVAVLREEVDTSRQQGGANFVALGKFGVSSNPWCLAIKFYFGEEGTPLDARVDTEVIKEAYERGKAERALGLPSHTPSVTGTWSSADYASLPPLSASASQATLQSHHYRLRHTGLLHLKGGEGSSSSTSSGHVLVSAGQYGIVNTTNYGALFNVCAVPSPANLAFSPLPLDFHTDNPYRVPVPGFQALHCLVQADEGGETLFCDGWAVAEELGREDPALLTTLLNTPLTFRYADATSQLSATRCVLGEGGGHVAYNARSQVALSLGRSALEIATSYLALTRFEELLKEDRFVVKVRLAPGDTVIWDNHRVLHGRAPFSGARHLQGCYLTRDSVVSNASVLLDRG